MNESLGDATIFFFFFFQEIYVEKDRKNSEKC